MGLMRYKNDVNVMRADAIHESAGTGYRWEPHDRVMSKVKDEFGLACHEHTS